MSFNDDDKMPFFKAKRPEIVRWVEPYAISSNQQKNPAQVSASKFVVAFEDGCIYLYEKDIVHN
jgi:hypothetical protein